MKIKSNVHTHTTFCDGADSAEDIVISAIELGCDTLGFSGHSPITRSDGWAMTDEGRLAYIKEIQRLREKYGDRISILLGIERDAQTPNDGYPYDFVIGSVHSVDKNGRSIDVDESFSKFSELLFEYYGGDWLELCRDYYALESTVVDKTDCDIIAHFDLITKYNEKHTFIDIENAEYQRIALDALDCLIEKKRIFEINTGAISRGWKSVPYPAPFLLKRLAERGADVMITSDCHSKSAILGGFDDAVEYARECGIKCVCVYKNGNIEKIKI